MKCYDCKYYLAIDVFKGICKKDRNDILADDTSCDYFEKAKKCIHCAHFKLVSEEMGSCMDKHEAYPQMNANTCSDFKWN